MSRNVDIVDIKDSIKRGLIKVHQYDNGDIYLIDTRTNECVCIYREANGND